MEANPPDFYSEAHSLTQLQRSGGWGMPKKSLMKYQGIRYYLFLKTKNLL
jgi:cation diffusion facilitator CzcD-associated flavoprotein CzcO